MRDILAKCHVCKWDLFSFHIIISVNIFEKCDILRHPLYLAVFST